MRPKPKTKLCELLNIKSCQFQIKQLQTEDMPKVIEICQKIFLGMGSIVDDPWQTEFFTDFQYSVKAVSFGRIIGCYLLCPSSLDFDKEDYTFYENTENYKSKKGLFGNVLALKPKYHGRGFGKQLRNVPLAYPFDYIWGYHLKSLNNLDHWTRFGRRVIAESNNCYMTLMDLGQPNILDPRTE